MTVAALNPSPADERKVALKPPRLRILLGAFGQPGHAFPMLALGARLAARGHAVAFETWSRWRPHVIAAGMEFVAAPEYHVFPTRERPLAPYEAVVLATEVTRRVVLDYTPDVIVHDILTLAPAMAGELERVPVATLVPHLYPVSAPGFPPYASGARLPRTAAGAALWRALDRPVQTGLRYGREQLNETRRRIGLPPQDRLHGGISAELCIVGTLPQLEYPRAWPSHVHVVGPLQWEPEYGIDPVLAPGADPIVLVAPSTAQDPGQRLLRATLNALAEEPVRVLATANRRPLPVPVRVASNSVLVNWVSYSRTMPRASLVVCHAGHGTLVRALACGRPVLAVPHSGDMAENAARAEWVGAAVRLPWRLLTPTTLRLAVRRALESDALAARARELSDWASENDGSTRAAELVEALASRSGEIASGGR